jgi:hypothetical protein
LAALSKDPGKIKALRRATTEIKTGVKTASWLTGASTKSEPTTQPTYTGYGSEAPQQYQMPVPKEAYMNYQGTPLKNIRPYTDTEISQAEMAQNWDVYLN